MLTFKNFKLGTKLNIILGLILCVSLIICGLSLSIILEKKVKQEVDNKAFLIIETMNSVRKYTNDQVKPELASLLNDSSVFIPETVPSYSAKEVFENLTQQPTYQNLHYKEATLNPTNPRDKADAFEAELVTQFRQNRDLENLTGFRKDRGNISYYIARPLIIKDASCLSCHSKPEEAPKNLIMTYGSENGFGWNLNEIVGTQIISVPANEIINTANKVKTSTIGIIFIILIITILGINLFLKQIIIYPIKNMSNLATKISTSDLDLNFEASNNDEIGNLAASLNRMILSLRMAINIINNQDND